MNEDRDIVLRIDRKSGILLAGVLAVAWGSVALSEQLTLTTSYPVPSGIYNQLITTGNSGATAADTTFNRNAGNTILVPSTNASGRVGVGTAAPIAKLDVAGSVRIADGTQGSDKILTSDVDGKASWKPSSVTAIVKTTLASTATDRSNGFQKAGSGAIAACAAGYVRTGCAATCTGIWNESDIQPVTGESCKAGSNDKCEGSDPDIAIYAICLGVGL